MKKKFLTLLLALAVSASVLAGCGNSAEPVNSSNVATNEAETAEVADNTETECEHVWEDATCEEPKHCSKCGETEGEALGHTLTEATYHEAATCTICGKTEGEPKQTYFEEHGAEVVDAPVACIVNALICNPDNPEKYQMTTDATFEQLDCYSEAAEEGYQLIHLELCISLNCYYDAAQDISYRASWFNSGIYDWYTGRQFPTRATKGNDSVDYGTTLEIDGVSYDVSYSYDVQWKSDGWVYNDRGDGTNNWKCYMTYTFKVPDDYDGLVYAAIPMNEYEEPDTETVVGTDEEGAIYAFDEDAFTEGTVFFRINKDGMVPERLPEDSTN